MLDILSPLRGYIAQTLHFYLGKYIEGIQLEGLGLFGGDLVLNDLEIKRHVLRESLEIPSSFDFSRGFIRELRIHIPWTQLLSQPIEVKLYTIELILTAKSDDERRPTRAASVDSPPKSVPADGESPEEKIEQPKSGWLHDMLQKILANISVQVNNLVLKYEHDDVVFSIALGTLDFYSANENKGWQRSFEELDGERRAICKRIDAKDLTIFLDRYTSEGVPENTLAQDRVRRKVVGYEVPVLSRTSASVRAKLLLFPNASNAAMKGQDGRKSRPTSPLHRPLPTPNETHGEDNIIDVDGLFSYRPSVMCDPFYYYSCNRLSVVPMYEVDIFISELLFSVSNRQLAMINQLIESASRKLDQAHEWAARRTTVDSTSGATAPDIKAEDTSVSERVELQLNGDQNADQEVKSSAKTQSSWFGWAMNALGTTEGEEEDELVSELLAETRGALLKAKTQSQAINTEDDLIPDGPSTKTSCVRVCISTASLTLRKHEKDDCEVERQDSTITESEELVPVANLGMVKVPIQTKKRKVARPAVPIFRFSLSYVALEMLLARGEKESGTDLVFEIEKVELVSDLASESRDDSKGKKGQVLVTWGSIDSSHFSDCVSHPYFISSFFGEETTRLNQRESRSFEIVKVSHDANIPVWKTLEVGRGRINSAGNDLDTPCDCSTMWNGNNVGCIPVATVSRICEQATRAIGIKERILDEGILSNAVSTAWTSSGFPVTISDRMARALASAADEYRAHRNPDLGALDNLAQLLLPQLVALFFHYTLHSCSATSLHASSGSTHIRHRSFHSAVRLRLASTSTFAARDSLSLERHSKEETVSRVLDISIGAAKAVLEPNKCAEIMEALSTMLRVNENTKSNKHEERRHGADLTMPTELEQAGPRSVVLRDIKLITVSSVRLCLPNISGRSEDNAPTCSRGNLFALVRDIMWMRSFRPGSSKSHFQLGTASVHIDASQSSPSSSAVTPLLEAVGFELLTTEKSGDGGDSDGLFVNLDKLTLCLSFCAVGDIASALDGLLSPLGWPVTWELMNTASSVSRTLFRMEACGAAFSRVVSNRPRLVLAQCQTLQFEIGSVSVSLARPTSSTDAPRVVFQGGAAPIATKGLEVNIPLLKIDVGQKKTVGMLWAMPLIGSVGLFSLNPDSLESACTRCQISVDAQCAVVFVDLNGVFQLIAVVLNLAKAIIEILPSGKKSNPPSTGIEVAEKLGAVASKVPTAWAFTVHLTAGGGTILLNDALQMNIPLISASSTDTNPDWMSDAKPGGKVNVVLSLQDVTLSTSDNGSLKGLADPMVLHVQGFSASAEFSHTFSEHRHDYAVDVSLQVSSIRAWLSRLKLLYLSKMPSMLKTRNSSNVTVTTQEKNGAENQAVLRNRWYWKFGGQLDLIGVTFSADIKHWAGHQERSIPAIVSGEISKLGVALRIGNHHPIKRHLEPLARGDFVDIQAYVGDVRVVERFSNQAQECRSAFGDFSRLPEHAFLGILVCLDWNELKCLTETLHTSATSLHEQQPLPAAMHSWHLTSNIAKAFQAQSQESAATKKLSFTEVPLLSSGNDPRLKAAHSFPLLAAFYRNYNEAGLRHYVISGSLESFDIALTTSSLYCLASVLRVCGGPSHEQASCDANSVNAGFDANCSDGLAKVTRGASSEPIRMFSLADLEVSILLGQVRLILPNETLVDCIASRQAMVKGNVCIMLESLSVASAIKNDITLDGLGYPPFNSRVLPRRPTVQAHRFGQSQLRIGCRAGKIVGLIADLTFDHVSQRSNNELRVAGPFEELMGHATGKPACFSTVETFWSPFNVSCSIEEEGFTVGEGGELGVKTLGTITLTKWRFDLHKSSFDELIARSAGVVRGIGALSRSVVSQSSTKLTPAQYTKSQQRLKTLTYPLQREMKFSCDGIEVNLFSVDASTHLRVGSIEVTHNFSSLSGSASIQNGAVGYRANGGLKSPTQKTSLSEEVVFGANADPSLWQLAVENYPEKLIAARWNFGEQTEGTLFLDVQAYQLHISNHFILMVSQFVPSKPQFSFSACYFDERGSQRLLEPVERQPFHFQTKWTIKLLIAPSLMSYWKRDMNRSRASGIWVTSGQVFASVGIGSDEMARQSLRASGPTVNEISRFVAVPTLELMLNADKFGVNTSDDVPTLIVHIPSSSVGSVSIHASSTWQQLSKFLSNVSEAQRLLHDCSVRVTGDQQQVVERLGLGERGICLLYSGMSRTNIQAEVDTLCVKLSSCSLRALQSLLAAHVSNEGDGSAPESSLNAANMSPSIASSRDADILVSDDISNDISTDDFKGLMRMAECRRPSPGELVFTEALFIETQSIISSTPSSQIAATKLHIQIDPNSYDIELADLTSYIQDVNEPWHNEEISSTMNMSSAPDLGNKTHSWMGMRWCYHLPRRIINIKVNPVPIPPTGIPSGWPTWSWNPDQESGAERLCDILCQLRCWDNKKSSYVLVCEFYAPWERIEVADDLDDAYEPGSFGELMSQWFDDDMEETRYRKKLLEFGSRSRDFSLDEDLASENWELRWRTPLRSEQESENKQKRLVVNALLASSLQVSSILTCESYQRVVASITLPQVALSVSYVGPVNDSHDVITAELNDTTLSCAISGSDRTRKMNMRVSSTLKVYLDNMAQLLTVSVIPRTTIDAMMEVSSKGLEVSTLVGPISVYLNQTSMLVISSIPKLLQVNPTASESNIQRNPDEKLSNMRIKLVNAAGIDIWYRQEGTLECLKLDTDTSAAYSWLSLADSPFYQLRFSLLDPHQNLSSENLPKNKHAARENCVQVNEDSGWCDPCRIKENAVTGRFFGGHGFLWICVELSGLQTVVTLRSSLTFRNYCEFPVRMKLNGHAKEYRCARSENLSQAIRLNQESAHSNCISLNGTGCSLSPSRSANSSTSLVMVESTSNIDIGIEGGPWCSVSMQENIPADFDLVKVNEEEKNISCSLQKYQRSFEEFMSQNPEEPSHYVWVKFGRAQCHTVLPTDFDPLQPQISRRYTWMELSLWPAIILENVMDIPVILDIFQKSTRENLKMPPSSEKRLSTINPFEPMDVQLQYGQHNTAVSSKTLEFSLRCSADRDDAKDQILDFAGCRVVTTVHNDVCPLVRIRMERVLSVVNMTSTALNVCIGSPLGNQSVLEKIDSCVEQSISFSVVSNRLVVSIGRNDDESDREEEENRVKWSPKISLILKGDAKPIVVPAGKAGLTSMARSYSVQLANSDGYLKLIIRPQVVVINSTNCELRLLPTDGRGNALVDEDKFWSLSGKNVGWCAPVCLHKEAKKRSITADVSSWLSSRLSRRPSEDLSTVSKHALVARLSCSFRICLAEDGYEWTEEISVLLPKMPLQLRPDGGLSIVELQTSSTTPANAHEGLYPAPSTTTQRRRLLIRHRGFRHKMLTYTMTQSDKCINIMLFVDHQPPVILHNQWQSPLGFRNVSFPSDPEGVGADFYMEYDWSLQVSARRNESSEFATESDTASNDIKLLGDWLDAESKSSENITPDTTTASERMRFQIGSPQYGWSNPLWQVGGIQFASFSNPKEEGMAVKSSLTFLVMCFYRAGSWLISITCLEDPTRGGQLNFTPSLALPSTTTPAKNKLAPPSFLKVGVVVEELSLHFCDEHDPVRDVRGLILYPEILRATCNAMSVVFSTTPDPPEVARHSTKLGYLSHIRSYTTLFLSVEDIEVDHFLQTCNFPVILCFPESHASRDLLQFDRVKKHERLANLLNTLLDKQLPGESDTCLIARVIYTDTWDPVGIPSYFHSIELKLAPAVLQVEDNILSYVNAFLRPVLDALQGEVAVAAKAGSCVEYPTTQVLHQDTWILGAYKAAAVTKQRKVYIEYLEISSLQVIITARVSIPVLNSFDGTPLHFGSTRMREVFSFPDQLLKDLAADYVADTIVRSPMLLMSLNILGNPAGFLRSFGQGVRDLVEIPLTASRNGYSPWVLTKGVMGGVASFLGHATTAALTSVSGFSYSISRTMDQLTLPSEQLKKRHYRRPTQLSSALADGLGSLGSSVVGAAAGVITTPLALYKERQMQGLDTGIQNVVGGVGMGLVGIVARPMGGVASLVSMASDGLLYGSGMGGNRIPCDESYSRFDARPNELLRYKLKVLPDVTGSHLIFAHGVWIVPDGNHLLTSGKEVQCLSSGQLQEQESEPIRSILLPADITLRVTQVTVVCSNEFLYVVGVSGAQNQVVLVRTSLQAIQVVEESLKEPTVFDLGVKTPESVEWLRFRLPPRQRRQLSHQLRLWLAEDATV